MKACMVNGFSQERNVHRVAIRYLNGQGLRRPATSPPTMTVLIYFARQVFPHSWATRLTVTHVHGLVAAFPCSTSLNPPNLPGRLSCCIHLADLTSNRRHSFEKLTMHAKTRPGSNAKEKVSLKLGVCIEIGSRNSGFILWR